jgi:hypothetical protein
VSTDEGFDLAAAGLRADGVELATSLEVLARKLEDALPGQTDVRRGGGLLGRGAKRVREIRVRLGSSLYALSAAGGAMEGFRERQVGGISIKREPLAPAEWMTALTAELREQAQRSLQAKEALAKLLG